VPSIIPHESGARTFQSIIHILTPRFIFQSKDVLVSDTVVTRYYTGLDYYGANTDNVSISIGYLGELYIDFGYFGAICGALIFGLVIGLAYRAAIFHKKTATISNFALACLLILPLYAFETALIKIIGSIITIIIAIFVTQRFVLTRTLFGIRP
jgi:hypothetical protein